jgi:predicted phosphoadenosine phosphosulfate sulfurtransferase
MCADEARRRGRRITAMFIDWEAQYELTVKHVRACLDMYQDCVDPIWICVPLRTTNACSVYEPEWICWDPDKRDRWVRDMPNDAVCSFPFYEPNMTYEHFVDALTRHLGAGTTQLLGLRCDESLDRLISVMDDLKVYKGKKWTTETIPGVVKATPIYDWKVSDVWTYHAKTGKPYNRLYDRFHQAGLSVHRMRICEPYGNEQRQGLQLFHVIEPDTWRRVMARVAGANTAALYAREGGNVLGNRKIQLPQGLSWKEFATMLLDSMPGPTREHYRNKLAVYLKWYRDHDTPTLPDELPRDTGAEDVGSWRRICKTLLKNDYWCLGLGFAPQKTGGYEKYRALMQRRRNAWRIYADS